MQKLSREGEGGKQHGKIRNETEHWWDSEESTFLRGRMVDNLELILPN